MVTVVAPLNPDKTLFVELSFSNGMFICLKAGSCSRLAALLGSTSTLCTSKLLIYKVSTSASWYGVTTLDGLGRVNRGKGYGAVNRLNCFATVWDIDGIHPSSGCGCSQEPSFLALGLILIVNRVAQNVIDGRSRFRRKL